MTLSTYLEIEVKPDIFSNFDLPQDKWCKVRYVLVPCLVRHLAPRPDSASRKSFNCIAAINKVVVTLSTGAMETSYILFTPD